MLLVAPAVAPAQELITSGRQQVGDREGTNVIAVVGDSMKLLLIEHAFRIGFQSKTRDALAGNFWEDYKKSVRVPPQWEDTDDWWVNYIGHPIHGAAAGYIWLDHEPGAPTEFSLTSKYWASRGRAMAWSAAYSLQFEIGPLSEASIGNVGMNPRTTGWVDHVITPLGAFGLIVAEDALDRYFVTWLEERVRNGTLRGMFRVLLNPGRALSNSATGRLPWYRDDRPISWR